MKKDFINKIELVLPHFILPSGLYKCTETLLMEKTYETLLTYDLRIRNTDPSFQLVSCYEKHF